MTQFIREFKNLLNTNTGPGQLPLDFSGVGSVKTGTRKRAPSGIDAQIFDGDGLGLLLCI